jgi:cell wall-associated NlpC family hydrolase
MLTSPFGQAGYIPRGTAGIALSTADLAGLVRLARTFVGVPYLWGGVSPSGFDCSGFVQRLFHYCFNLWLPRDTVDQRRVGKPVELGKLERGDLCFFPRHVALYVGDGEIIHSNRQHKGASLDGLLEPEDAYCKGFLRDFQGARRIGVQSSG